MESKSLAMEMLRQREGEKLFQRMGETQLHIYQFNRFKMVITVHSVVDWNMDSTTMEAGWSY